MKKGNTELFIAGIVAVAIAALVTGAWKVKSDAPLKKAPVMSVEKVRASNEVVNDISRELLTCYNYLDQCSLNLSSCVEAYIRQQGIKEVSP